jgi:hypothetical protein
MWLAHWPNKCIKILFVRKKSAHKEFAHKIFGKVLGLGSKNMRSKKTPSLQAFSWIRMDPKAFEYPDAWAVPFCDNPQFGP